jgi:hypothetical protein
MDIDHEEERRGRLGYQALRHHSAGKADLERRGVVDFRVGPPSDAAGDLHRSVVDEPEEHVDQVRPQIKQGPASSLSRSKPAIVEGPAAEYARDGLDVADGARCEQIVDMARQREPA